MTIFIDLSQTARQFLRELFASQADSLTLARIEAKVDRVLTNNERMERLMNEETTSILKRLDDATTAIAGRLQKLIDSANQAGSVSAAEINAALGPEVARLEGLAVDPANPVPTPAAPASSGDAAGQS